MVPAKCFRVASSADRRASTVPQTVGLQRFRKPILALRAIILFVCMNIDAPNEQKPAPEMVVSATNSVVKSYTTFIMQEHVLEIRLSK